MSLNETRDTIIRTALHSLPGAHQTFPGTILFSLPASYGPGRVAPAVTLELSVRLSQWAPKYVVTISAAGTALTTEFFDDNFPGIETLTRRAVLAYNAQQRGRTIISTEGFVHV